MNAAVEVPVAPSSPAARAANDAAPKEASASPPPRSKRALIFALLALVVLAAGGSYGAYWKTIGSRYVKTDDAYTAAEVALVTAQIDGPVAQVNVVDSQEVKRGDVLVVIDDTDARLALRQAQADLARYNAQVISATADVERTHIDLQRRQALVASGSVSGDELTRVINGDSDARATLNAAHAAVALAQARVDKAQVDLGRTVIRSPVDGIIARRQVQLGQRVQPSTPLLSVVPVRDMYVNANFKEVQLRKVRAGQQVELIADLYGHKVDLPRRHLRLQRRHRLRLRTDTGAERDGQLDQGGAASAGTHCARPQGARRASAAGRTVGGRQSGSAQQPVCLRRPRSTISRSTKLKERLCQPLPSATRSSLLCRDSCSGSGGWFSPSPTLSPS